MRIAIIGAGFSGIAAAWHLIQLGHHVTIFDAKEIGNGTSGMAAGLLHGYVGANSKRNAFATEGLQASLKLLQIASNALGVSVFHQTGVLRPAISEQQNADFKLRSHEYHDLHWYTAEECQNKIPQLVSVPGMFIQQAYIVDCKKYLEGLWLACGTTNAKFEVRAIQSLEELNSWDCVVAATGADSGFLPELAKLPITRIKGQVLKLQMPNDMLQLSFPLNSQAYLIQQGNSPLFIAGATYERHFKDVLVDEAAAVREIMPKIEAFLPAMSSAELIQCFAGVRASTPQRMPIVKQINQKCWVFTGLGSRGLLYHAYFAEELARSIHSL